jgi:hypothetical protein
MPTLNWIGKEAVVNHHQQVPFHLLKDVPELACGEPGDGKLLARFFDKYEATVRYRASQHILLMVVAVLQHLSIGMSIAA